MPCRPKKTADEVRALLIRTLGKHDGPVRRNALARAVSGSYRVHVADYLPILTDLVESGHATCERVREHGKELSQYELTPLGRAAVGPLSRPRPAHPRWACCRCARECRGLRRHPGGPWGIDGGLCSACLWALIDGCRAAGRALPEGVTAPHRPEDAPEFREAVKADAARVQAEAVLASRSEDPAYVDLFGKSLEVVAWPMSIAATIRAGKKAWVRVIGKDAWLGRTPA